MDSFIFQIDVLQVFFFELSVLGDEMSKNLEACDLLKSNDTDWKGLVEFLRDQLSGDFLARTIDCVVFVK